jgi:hypothetical protein
VLAGGANIAARALLCALNSSTPSLVNLPILPVEGILSGFTADHI